MTITIKLEAPLEARLRQRAARSGRSTSDVVRAALTAYLDQPDADEAPSPHDLGADLFGRYQGPTDLAQTRKQHASDVYAERHARRGR